ncbi:leucine-rich repeat protein [Lachnospiraceae bacterium 46-15]
MERKRSYHLRSLYKKTERTDTEQLQTIITAAEEETKQELYTPESYNKFAKAITAAKELLEQAASAEDKAKALKAIYEAAGSLVLQKEADEKEETENKQAKKDLADAVTGAKALIDAGGSKFTETSWNAFVLAYRAAAEVSENADTTTVKRLLLELQKAEKELTLADSNNTEKPPVQTPGDPSVKPPVSVKPAPAEGALKKGDTDSWKTLRYRVTDAAKKQVEVYGVNKKSMTKVTIPATAKVKGVVCIVTGVSNKAFAGMKKLKSVTIGKNVTTIGKKAFYNDKRLKTITVKSKVLKKVAKDALQKTYKKGTIKVPKSKKKAYTKLFKKRGQKRIK